MKRMQIDKNHKALIESVIRESDKFVGNEELIDIFCEAIYKKSYLLIDAIKDMSRLRRHLLAICDTCIEQVLREKQKFDEIKMYKQIERTAKVEKIANVTKNEDSKNDNIEKKLQNAKKKEHIVSVKEEMHSSDRYESVDLLIDPIECCPVRKISQGTLKKLINIVKKIDTKYPAKKYYEIFNLRYVKNLNQTEIAKEMKISQVELSRRFVELVKLTRENL